jgi:hypothetical protein
METSALSTAKQQRLVLGQEAVDVKSNEIVAIFFCFWSGWNRRARASRSMRRKPKLCRRTALSPSGDVGMIESRVERNGVVATE